MAYALLPDNAGRYRLRTGPDGIAHCERTTEPADLACDIAALGAAYLGGTRLRALAEAGRVVELRPGTFGRHRRRFRRDHAGNAVRMIMKFRG